jgi:serine/threonine protein kinase
MLALVDTHEMGELAGMAATAPDGLGQALVAHTGLDLAGKLLTGRYRVFERLGAGGMGTVYRAEHVTLRKQVAIKVLEPNLALKQTAVDRFLHEARTVSQIHHENVVEIIDFGFTDEQRLPFFAMELLQGEELADRLKRSGPLPWSWVREVLVQILAALEAAHEEGVIHRDMKPQNCFLIRKGERKDVVKVLDFGLAKVISGESDFQSLSQTGAVLGTVHYMSPEQARSEKLDVRTDIYSVGVIAFELLTGCVPYHAAGAMGVLSKLLTSEIPTMASVAPDVWVHPRVEALVRKAMAKDREDRHASAVELAAAIRELPEDIDDEQAGRRFGWKSGVAAGGVALLALLLGFVWSDEGSRSAAANEEVEVATSTTAAEAAVEQPTPPPIVDLPRATEIETDGETGSAGSASSNEEPPPTELPATLTDKQVSQAYRRTAYQAVRTCGLESGLRVGEELQIQFGLSRETGRAKSVTFPSGGDPKLTSCVKIAMEKKMAAGPFRGGKSSYTVTHQF